MPGLPWAPLGSCLWALRYGGNPQETRPLPHCPSHWKLPASSLPSSLPPPLPQGSKHKGSLGWGGVGATALEIPSRIGAWQPRGPLGAEARLNGAVGLSHHQTRGSTFPRKAGLTSPGRVLLLFPKKAWDSGPGSWERVWGAAVPFRERGSSLVRQESRKVSPEGWREGGVSVGAEKFRPSHPPLLPHLPTCPSPPARPASSGSQVPGSTAPSAPRSLPAAG